MEIMDTLFELGAKLSDMKPSDIPLAAGVDEEVIKAIKGGDDDPLEVVVEIPASVSTRDWTYTSEMLDDVVESVMVNTAAGYKGHQREEDIANEFLNPATHWIGAIKIGDSAYIRGIVDKGEPDLKRYIRAKRITQVSVFGNPHVTYDDYGDVHVVGYDLLSIDWTPLGRAGMPTSIVAIGEMSPVDKKVKVNKKKEVTGMNPTEVLTKLKECVDNGTITPKMIHKKIGAEVKSFVGEMDSKFIESVNKNEEALANVKKVLGVSGEMSLADVAKEAAEAMQYKSEHAYVGLVGEMAKTKIDNEAARKDLLDDNTVIGSLWAGHTASLDKKKATKESISGEMDNFLAKTAVKDTIANYAPQTQIYNPVGGGQPNQTASGIVVRKVTQ